MLAVLCILLIGEPVQGASSELKVNAGVREEYNDNIFFSNKNEEDDFITTGIIGLDYKGATERATATLKARVEGQAYLDNSDLSDVNQYYTAGLSVGLTPRLSLIGDGRFEIDNRPDRDVDETGLSTQGSEERMRQRYSGGFEYQLSELTRLFATANAGRDDYEGNSDNDDFKTWGGEGGVTRVFSSFQKPTVGRLAFGYSRFDYDDADTDYYYTSMGVSRELSETYTLAVYGGVRYTDTDYDVRRRVLDPGPPPALRTTIETVNDQNWGGNGSASLSFKDDRTRWEIAASHDLTGATSNGQSVKRTKVAFDIYHRWDWALGAGLTARYFINKSEVDDPGLGEVDDRTLYVRPRVRYHFTDDLYLEASYRYTYQDDREDDTHSQRNQAFLELRYAPVIWE
jgi:hypothetical protein